MPPTLGDTLLALTKRWLAVRKKVGKLEIQRSKLAAKENTTARDPRAMTRLRAQWIRLVSLILSNLEVSKADLEAIETIRGPTLEASKRAGRRYETAGAIASAEVGAEAGAEGIAACDTPETAGVEESASPQ